MLLKKHWTILPAALVSELPNLRLSPLGVVPQHDRRPRTIVDYTFSSVNEDTVIDAPTESMQFGRTLHRLLSRILHADPRFGHVYISKIDIADGFYRIWLRACDIPILGVLFPTVPGAPDLIGFPLTLPMGWVQSPPFFSAATETVADLANASFATASAAPAHRLEVVAETARPTSASPLPPPSATSVPLPCRHRPLGPSHSRQPLAYSDVYVDDFIMLAQGSTSRWRTVKRTILHALDLVFRPLSKTDDAHRQEPASVKKFLKGDGTFSTILGWIIDTVASTICLPPHHLARLHDILASVPRTTHRISTKH